MVPTFEQQIIDLRSDLAETINRAKDLANASRPPVVQELILAQRHAEDARMRLGVALARLKGEDPFRDREPEIAKGE